MNLKQYFLISCLFLVLCTRIVSVYEALLTDEGIELSEEVDKEDASDEEDPDNETSEKDILFNEHNIYLNASSSFSLLSNSKFIFNAIRYSSPTAENFSSPPEFI